MKHKESNLQQRCIKKFRREYPELSELYFSVPNGAHVSQSQARILVAEGLTEGVSDTLLLVPRNGKHGLCIEYKQQSCQIQEDGTEKVVRKTYQRKSQKEWQKQVEAQGYQYEVVRSIEDFEKIVYAYLGDPNITALQRLINNGQLR